MLIQRTLVRVVEFEVPKAVMARGRQRERALARKEVKPKVRVKRSQDVARRYWIDSVVKP